MTPAKTALFALAATAALAAAGYGVAQTTAPAPAAPAAATAADLKPGVYKADPGHTKITWSVSHGGFSTYSGQFADVTADLTIGATPQASSLSVTAPVARIITGSTGLDGHLSRADFFDAANFAAVTFKSTSITVTSPNTGKVTGDVTIKGVTKPLTLDVVFRKGAPGRNGGYQIGFDAKGVVKRSEFGLIYGLPNLGDEVTLQIGSEFRAAPPAQP